MKCKKFLSFVLATIMAISLLPTLTLTAYATSHINSVTVVGNGKDGNNWLNDINWAIDDKNNMTETQAGVYEITYTGVKADSNFQVGFALNGSWSDCFSGSISSETAVYKSNDYITFPVADDNSAVKIVLDLRNFNDETKEGAIYKLYVNGVQINNSQEKNITLGTEALIEDRYVYYGAYNSSPIKWHIISTNGNGGTYSESVPYEPKDSQAYPTEGTVFTDNDDTKYIYSSADDRYHRLKENAILLLSEYGLKNIQYTIDLENFSQFYPADWWNSDAWTWCNTTAEESLSSVEKSNVLLTSKAATSSNRLTDELRSDAFFFLNYKEFTNYAQSTKVAYPLNSTGLGVAWWLRYPISDNYVIYVDLDGKTQTNKPVTTARYARPAFNLNSDSVLFTSAKGIKAIDEGNLKKNEKYEISGSEKCEYKLTVLDTNRNNFTVTDDTATGKKGDTVTFYYENAQPGDNESGNNEYVSAMIVDGSEVLYYGQLANITAASGAVDFTIPSDIDYGTYKLLLFNEQINGDKETDCSSKFQEVTLNVVKQKATFSTPPIANELSYNGYDQYLVTAGTPIGGTVLYSLKEDEDYSDSVPTRRNAGTYTVWYYIKGDDNHSDSDKASIQVKISQKPIAATIEDIPAQTYTGSEIQPEIAVYDGATEIPKKEYKVNYSNNINAGLASVTVEGAENGNYDVTANATFTINPLPVIIKWSGTDGLVYNGTPQEVTAKVSNKYETDEVNLIFSDDSHSLIQTDKGVYKATVTGVDNDNYTADGGANLTKEWSISQANDNEITDLYLEGWTYGDTPNEPTANAKYGTPEYSYSAYEDGTYTATVPTNAGTYWVKATVTGTENFSEKSSEPFMFTIEKANSSVTKEPKKVENLVYTGEELNLISEDGAADGGVIKYSVDGENFDYAFADIPKVTNAKDDYKIWYKVVGDENHNDTTAVCIEIKVAKKPVNTAIELTAPVKNAAPQTSIKTKEYTATVSWLPEVAENGSFAKKTVYTAVITITPNPNYTVSGITESECTVEGADSVTLESTENDKAVINAVFPQTAGSSSGGGAGGSSVSRYTVSFETNGGSAVADQAIERNSLASKPTAPTKDGYIFGGWYSDSELTNEYNFGSSVTKNITLYAKWTEDEAQQPNGGKDDVDNEQPSSGNVEDADNEQPGSGNTPSANDRENPFIDVTKKDWFCDSVKYANENGLMSGTADNLFSPNDNITRGMFVTVLYRLDGEPEVNKSIPFTDVTADMYYANAVIWAEQNNLVQGISETEFAPDMNITREQLAAIIYRYAEYKGIAPTGAWAIRLSYSDMAEISDYAVNGVMYCTLKNIMQGKDNNMFAPKANATRAEVAAIIQRFIENNK